MGFYDRRPKRLLGQVTLDIFVAVWVGVWLLFGRFMHAVVSAVAAPARQTAKAASTMSRELSDSADQASRVPAVGDDLARGLDGAAQSLLGVVASANQQVILVERLAVMVGIMVFLIPVAIVIAWWLPRRVRFFRRARASQRYIDSAADLDLFALRAMASQPMYILAEISEDPVRAWREGDRAVIDQLAEIELRESGLRMPNLQASQPVR